MKNSNDTIGNRTRDRPTCSMHSGIIINILSIIIYFKNIVYLINILKNKKD